MNSDQLSALEEKLTSLEAPTNDDVDKVIKAFQPTDIPKFSLESQLKLINKCFSANSYEGVLEKLTADGSEFAQAQLRELEKMVSILAFY